MTGTPDPGARRIWVLIEQDEGQAHPVSRELLGAAQRLASELDGKTTCVEAVLPGHGVRHIAEDAFRYGASRVYLLDDPALAIYRNLPYAVAVSRLAQTYGPEILLIGATTRGRDLASAIATRLETGLTADCTELSIDPKLGILAATRPTFGGNLMATILCRKHRPQMATVRPRVLPVPLPLADATGDILTVEPGLCEADIPVRRLRLILSEERLNLEHAEVIVAGGRGLGGPDGLPLLGRLADLLGGVVAVSRPLVDAGWISADHQVGQTGKTVRPKLDIAAGISGAVQHRVGMGDADFILAINPDPEAPIFRIADLGIVGDLYEVVPELIRQVQAMREGDGHAR